MPLSTVSAVLKREGMGRLGRIGMEPVKPFAVSQPGEVIHLDVKKLGRITRGPGHRIAGRGNAPRPLRRQDETGNKRGLAGWDAVHVAIDGYSRLAYAEVLPDETATTTVGFLQRALAFYAAHGIAARRVHTDNGSNYVSAAFRVACGMPHLLCVFRETCGDVVVLEHDGSLYACDHFVDQAHRLGNLRDTPLSTLLADPALELFGRRKQQALPRCCRDCELLAWCNGGCPKDRMASSRAGEPGLSYLCPAFQRFFQHCRPIFARLAAHCQAGGTLSQFSTELRAARPATAPKPGRNDPCPCGSGRKYKKCCLSRG